MSLVGLGSTKILTECAQKPPRTLIQGNNMSEIEGRITYEHISHSSKKEKKRKNNARTMYRHECEPVTLMQTRQVVLCHGGYLIHPT